MLLRPTRIVRATTEQELDSALGAADQVIVEGDDRLLSYAVAKASNDPQNRIDIETGKIGGSISVDDAMQSRSPKFVNPVLVLLLLVCLVTVGGYFLSRVIPITGQINVSPAPAREVSSPAQLPGATPGPPVSSGQPPNKGQPPVDVSPAPKGEVSIPSPGSPGGSGQRPNGQRPVITGQNNNVSQGEVSIPSPAPPQNAPPPSNVASLLQTLAWPVVTLVAIIALFLIAWQAIARGRNVEVSWKVTEKVTGRVVITKVQTRATKRAAA